MLQALRRQGGSTCANRQKIIITGVSGSTEPVWHAFYYKFPGRRYFFQFSYL